MQDQLNLEKHKLIIDVTTRWNSTYYMLKRNLEQRKAFVIYAVDNKIPTLTTYQWGIVQKIVQLLSPFEEITKEGRNSTSTISMIIPRIWGYFYQKLTNLILIFLTLMESFLPLSNHSVNQWKQDFHPM